MKIDCPTCGQDLQLPKESAGTLSRCPTCSSEFVAPSLAALQARSLEASARAASRVLWALAALAIVASALFTVFLLLRAESAPQECSALALGCFLLVGIYTLARAVEGMSGGSR